MAILENTMRLNNEMSSQLDEIKNSALEARAALGGWEERIKAAEKGLFSFEKHFEEIAGRLAGKEIEVSVVAKDENISRLFDDAVKNVKLKISADQATEITGRIERLAPEIDVKFRANADHIEEIVNKIESFNPEISVKFIADAKKMKRIAELADSLELVEVGATLANEALEKIPGTLNEIADYIALVTEKSKKFKDYFGVAFDDIIERNEEMLENFAVTKEQIAEMSDAIHEKVEAIEATGDAIDKVGNKAGASSRGMNQMAGAVARLLGSLGVIPKSVAQGTMAVTQLNKSMQSTLPIAAKLTAMLGPITLIATGIMAIVNTISMFQRSTKEEILPSFDELVSRAGRLNDESETLSVNLKENIELMCILAGHGASDALTARLELDNELLRQRIELTKHAGRYALGAAAGEAIDTVFGREMERQWIEEVDAFGKVTYNRRNILLDSLFMEKEARIKMLDEIEYYEKSAIADTLLEWGRKAATIREFGDEAMQVYAERIDSIIALHNRMAGGFPTDELLAEQKKLLGIYDRQAARVLATAEAHSRAQNHIIRSYRDTYAAAESLRGAHHALQHAIEGTNSAYYSHLDYFNQVMSLAPEYLNFLFDEHGALIDVEDAVYKVTQAQIELMGVRQANAFLDMVTMWDAEGNALGIYTNAVHNATDGVWGLVAARTAALQAAEKERLVDRGYDVQSAAIYSQRAMAPIMQRLETIQGMAETAQQSARERVANGTLERGVFRPDGAMLVADVGLRDIMGEFVRIREDVARRDYMEGAFQQRDVYAPASRDASQHPTNVSERSVVINMGGMGGYSYSPQVYPAELSASSRADIVREGAQNGARLVAEQIENVLEGAMF